MKKTISTVSPNLLLDKLAVVHVDFDIWSGQTRLSGEDLQLGAGVELPPEKLARLGSKTICNPDSLRVFTRIKAKTRRLLEHYGLPFLNGYAVPVQHLDQICAQIDLNIREFNNYKQRFIQNYNAAVESWIAVNASYEDVIRRGILPVETVERRIGCDYQVFMIQPTADGEERQEQLLNKISGLSDDLISEIVREANDFYVKHLVQSDRCGIGTKRTLVNLKNKIEGLSFLKSTFTPLVTLLNNVIKGYNDVSGKYVIAPFIHQLSNVVLILSSAKRIDEYANGVVAVHDTREPTVVAVTEPVAEPVSLPESVLPLCGLGGLTEPDEDDIESYFTELEDESFSLEETVTPDDDELHTVVEEIVFNHGLCEMNQDMYF